MPAGSAAVKERHQPLVLVDTAGLSEEEWLAYRRKGIGGSDVAALLGISPWRTARDLFYDKLNIAVVEDHEDNWVALEMGHLLEPLVAKIFQHRTGYKIYQIKKMFQHPEYCPMYHSQSRRIRQRQSLGLPAVEKQLSVIYWHDFMMYKKGRSWWAERM